MLTELMATVMNGQALSQTQSQQLFAQIMAGEVGQIELAGILTAMKMRGETVDEITGAASALRAAATPFPRPKGDLLDIVGTGGDGANTINISTTSIFVAAAAGARIAKHGNRSVSSQSGASDLLTQFGVNLTMSPQQSARCLEQLGVTFLFAPHYHGGIRHAMPVRQALKTRTLFNVLGPLINPARPNQMLLGVYSPELVQPIAETIAALGVERALVVHGLGLDEIAIHGETHAVELQQGQLIQRQYTPADLGVSQHHIEAIKGGNPAENHAISQAILGGGGTDAQRSAVAVNAGAGLYLTGKADSLAIGTELAFATMDSGKPLQLMQAFAEMSNQQPEQ
ncbi:anthranilate phosphoribosyltransferase [Ferrimonas sp. SCSIO 43195]|uniref:anthranilate phosphoribosyltransferase n=1 Tax=Ferrimonas sp. SCSIO 43195 TaxID=2822844 RepID=UPI0020751A16|nr:anthranilate phosphoribosyltransferase [Ferrimonas sp. SCSIO 43195]USD36497.1 anthranilate phosphoribosyltransferase [Ferrimonas sp. SCSIO 43195]